MPESNFTTNNLIKITSLLLGTPTASTSYVNKFGEQVDIDTEDVTGALTQIIWPVKRSVQDYLFIDSPIALTIQSDNANDTEDGTGARTAEVFYHDNNGNSQTEELTLLGTTPVDIPTDSYGVFRIEIKTSGTSNTNEGTITVTNGGNIYAIVLPGEGQTQIAVQRIPNNISSAIVKYARITYARIGNNNDATTRLKVRTANGTKLTKLNVILTSTGLTDFEREYSAGGISLNPGDWIYWECTDVSANGTPIAGYLDIIENV